MRRNEIDPEALFEVDTKKMFDQVKSEDIPFHNWHVWVDNYIE